MRLLGRVNTEQRCEIQSVWNAWIQAEQEKHCVQRDSQKASQSTHLHYLPWIYCGKYHFLFFLFPTTCFTFIWLSVKLESLLYSYLLLF